MSNHHLILGSPFEGELSLYATEGVSFSILPRLNFSFLILNFKFRILSLPLIGEVAFRPKGFRNPSVAEATAPL